LNRTAGLSRELLFLGVLLLFTTFIGYAIQLYLSSELDENTQDIDRISLAWEMRFKTAIKQFIAADASLVENDELNGVIADLARRLRDHIKADHPYEIEILVVDSRMVNAMALPGGLIILYVPLIRLTETPEELAAVMAHELGHVIHRDPLRKMIRQMGIAATLALLRGDSSTLLENTIRNLLDLKYTRDQESAADDFALETLVAAGIDPIHFAAIMEKLDPGRGGGKSKLVKYLSTHPHRGERVEKARRASAQFASAGDDSTIDWLRVKKLLPSVFD
jgi:predicted Zn-dependent protease